MRILPTATAAVLLLACSDEATPGSSASTSTGTGGPTSSASGAAPAGSPLGDGACESYAEKMRACIQERPEAERPAMQKPLDATLAAIESDARCK